MMNFSGKVALVTGSTTARSIGQARSRGLRPCFRQGRGVGNGHGTQRRARCIHGTQRRARSSLRCNLTEPMPTFWHAMFAPKGSGTGSFRRLSSALVLSTVVKHTLLTPRNAARSMDYRADRRPIRTPNNRLALLGNERVRELLGGADVFVVSHHGRESATVGRFSTIVVHR